MPYNGYSEEYLDRLETNGNIPADNKSYSKRKLIRLSFDDYCSYYLCYKNKQICNKDVGKQFILNCFIYLFYGITLFMEKKSSLCFYARNIVGA